MDNSILVGKYIYKSLVNDSRIQEVISGDKIFPLAPRIQYNEQTGKEEDITFPFCVYAREALTPIYTKDMLTDNEVIFSVVVLSDDYLESLELANLVRNNLECKTYKDDDIFISRIKLESCSEETLDEAYIQKLTFKFTVR